MTKSLSKILIAVAICLAVGFLSSYATQGSIETWYAALKKPTFNPPNWVFAPVWTVLYVLMGIAAGIVWSKGLQHKLVKNSLLYFAIQLALNGLWTIVFFGFKNIVGALVVIALLLLMIFLTYLRFKVVDKKEAYLLITFIVWVCFATVLHFAVGLLNTQY